MLWENLREEEFEGAIERSKGLCVLPISCLEKHGQHLPVGADWFEAYGIAKGAAELEEAVVFHTGPWVGDVVGMHQEMPASKYDRQGYVSINPHTLLTVLEELCDEIARNGFRKILLLNGHGGNDGLVGLFQRYYRYKKRDYALLCAGTIGKESQMPYFYEMMKTRREEFNLTDEDMAVLKKHAELGTGVGHADFVESAMVMGFEPDLVRLDRHHVCSGECVHRTDHLSNLGITAGNFWINDYPHSYVGRNPEGLTEAIGKAHVQVLIERMARIYKAIKDDEDCIRMAQNLPKEV